MIKRALFLTLLAGCFPTRSQELTCDVTSDCDDGRVCEGGFCVATGSDAGVDEPDAGDADAAAFDCTQFSTKLFAGCDIPEPGAAIELTSDATYNTDTGTLDGVAVPSADLPAGKLISIQALTIASGVTLRVIGTKPLIIASWSTIDVAGVIDASSTATELGAGANPAGCSTHAAVAGDTEQNGGGGGGGGSMLAVGGRGGNGDDSNGGVGGTAVAAPSLSGGCAGAAGGTGRQAGGAGGAGGGAVALTALTSITIGGKINVGGAGGAGAAGENGGGGGGGSGGMITVESAAVSVTGTLAANGGGGGGGSTDNNNATGAPGQPGQISATNATGGAPNNNGDRKSVV